MSGRRAKSTALKSGKPQSTPPSVTTNSETDQDDYLFLFMPNEKYGEFCQWFPAQFTVSKLEIAGLLMQEISNDNVSDSEELISFKCSEQFMMYCKAGRFNDSANQARIMATSLPKEQKRLGRLTEGFTDASWDQVKSSVVEAGNMAKFSQNIHLRRKLLATGNRILVEAASRDRVWGIGFAAHRALPMKKHWGENLLGKALMLVRERLKEKYTDPSKYLPDDDQ